MKSLTFNWMPFIKPLNVKIAPKMNDNNQIKENKNNNFFRSNPIYDVNDIEINSLKNETITSKSNKSIEDIPNYKTQRNIIFQNSEDLILFSEEKSCCFLTYKQWCMLVLITSSISGVLAFVLITNK